jgi:hypothetical protein
LHLCQHSRVFYFLFFVVKVARTSRRKAHSGLIAPLEISAGCAHKKRQ